MAYRIFLSSTFNDLKDYRLIVQNAIRQLGAVDVSMEHFGARDERPLEACINIIQKESDLFVGIYAHRYGYIPDDQLLSITEMEYKSASDINLPRFIYIIDENQPWLPAYIDGGENKAKFDIFKKHLLKHHICQSFGSGDQLATKVVADIGRHIAIRDATRVGPGIPVQDIGMESMRNPAEKQQSNWSQLRRSIKTKNRNIYLTHFIRPSTKPDQQFDIYIYLMKHRSNDLSEIAFAEFYMGRYWNNKVFPAVVQNGFIGISTAAYGPFLCLCQVTFQDGEKVLLNRYIDFEAYQTGGAEI